ncbi:MAG TPA: HAMP domain-containing sensor histidine kinase [Pyrinomonadaceae bacterium]|nr:HAMP domain-containing sensor histidine kinase [Pyrinomonadaceae bacterium]
MKRLRTFFRRHLLWVGFFAATIPLISILVLQYWSLLKLEKTSTVAEKVWMKNYLSDVYKEIKYFYHTNAEQVLNTPASALTTEGLQKNKYLFGKCETEGAKLLFIAVFNKGNNAVSAKDASNTNASEVRFFNPRDVKKEYSPTIAEARAVNVAVAPLKLLSQEGSALQSPGLSIDDHDPENRVILKPVTNEWRKVVGVTGMILDAVYFRDVYLPRAIRNSLQKFFPDDAQENVIVTVQDGGGPLVMSTQPVRGHDTAALTNLPYFSDWKLGIRSRHMTPEQWARWNFNVNLTLSILMAIAVMGGIILALRTASRAMKLSQMKTDFVSNVSHELRTPLSSIRVFGEFLKLGRVKEHEKICEYGEYIETESRRLTQLINNILDFSKIESDRKTYNFESANIEDIIAATLKTFEVQLRQHNITIRVEPQPAQLPPVLIDTDAIAQAFMNLLDNAVKYSGSAKEIVVKLGRKDGFVTVSVKDYGIGIPREEQAKIFDKFYRVSTGLVHDVKGSGLGLSLVKHIVKAHRGRVTVESETGRGSTFTLYLPATESLSDRTEKPKATPALGTDRPLTGPV